MIRAPPQDVVLVSAIPKTVTSANSKRKSKFKKAPQAPKRFKSAYIFFSTEMMQRIKAQQKGGDDEKQKITDISKKISIAWKKLKPEDREKWNLIAKKDKERFLEEKKNYKGPWQLPVKQGNEQDPLLSKKKGASMSSLSESEEEHESYDFRPVKKRNKSRSGIVDSSSQDPINVGLKLVKVSQEERDAAHNLVQLHMQNKNNSSSSSISFNDYDDSREKNTSQEMHGANNHNLLPSHDQYRLNSNAISRTVYYPSLRLPYPPGFQHGEMQQINQLSRNGT